MSRTKTIDEIKSEMGKKIVNGIALSIAADKDFDTEPVEDWTIQALASLLLGLPSLQDEEMLTYGRSHMHENRAIRLRNFIREQVRAELVAALEVQP